MRHHTSKLGMSDLLATLKGVRRCSHGWIALCPAHGDKHRSLSVREGARGRILLRCFAGCSFQEIAAALDIELAQLSGTRSVDWRPTPRPTHPMARFVPVESAKAVEAVKLEVPRRDVTPLRFRDLDHWLAWRGIPTVGSEHAYSELHEWRLQQFVVFDYPEEGLRHWISVHKHGGAYRQFWRPQGRERRSLWHFVNPLLDHQDYRTAYLCAGEKDALALAQRGFYAFATPGSFLREQNAAWLLANARDVDRVRVVFDVGEERQGRNAAVMIKRAAPRLDVQVMVWPGDAPRGFDVENLVGVRNGTR